MLETEILSIALGQATRFKRNPTSDEWGYMFKYANKHGITGLLFSALEQLPKEQQPPHDVLMKWYGNVLFYERLYRKHELTISHLASFYSKHEISTMILKGYGISLYWPIPSRRAMGDIDTYNFGKWKDADSFMLKELNIKVDDSHEHHTVFTFEGCMVENHYDIVNTKAFRDAERMDRILKELAQDRISHSVHNELIYLPSPNFNAVFLLRHLGQHLGGEHINMRQLLDWAFFMKNEHDKVDWQRVLAIYDEFGLKTFFNYINVICADYLGFDTFRQCKWYDEHKVNVALSQRIFNDILSPEFPETEPNGKGLGTIIFKMRRFLANRWKRKLVTKESIFSTFIFGSLAHLRRYTINKIHFLRNEK